MINLGDKNWGVKDSGLLAYKQVGSKYFNKDFDFTRASNGTYVDKDGVLQTAELYNLVSYSQDFSQGILSNCTIESGYIAPNGTLNAYKLIEDSTNSIKLFRAENANNSTPNTSYASSIFVKSAERTKVRVYGYHLANQYFYVDYDLSDNTYLGSGNANAQVDGYSIEDVGNDWKRITIIGQKNATYSWDVGVSTLDDSGNVTYQGDGVSGLYIYGAQLVEGTEPLDYQYTNGRVGIPRIDFSDGVGALLLEPQRTNLINYSQDIDLWSNFVQGNGVIPITTANYAIAPDGTQTAERLQCNQVELGGANRSAKQISVPVINGTTYAFSFWVKSNTGENQQFSFTPSFANIISGNQQIVATNEWQRFEIIGTSILTGTSEIRVGLVSNSISTTNDVLVWGIQCEVGSYCTSYIKTSGSAVTRIADVANNCGSEQDFNSEEGVLYAEIYAFDDDAAYKQISIDDGTNNSRHAIWFYNNSIGSATIISSSYSYLPLLSTTFTPNNFYKIAYKYKQNDFALWVNGIEVGQSSTGNVPSGLSELDFDNGVTQLNFYGKARSVKYFPEALTDEQLENLTT